MTGTTGAECETEDPRDPGRGSIAQQSMNRQLSGKYKEMDRAVTVDAMRERAVSDNAILCKATGHARAIRSE